MASSDLTEQRFYAAVNVIRGLPKNGSYQPSHDMQLRFYSYFKQATEGRCNQKKPGIWNPVARAKWEAWTRLGNMPKEQAMNNYVEELKKIIETMSYTDNVADFMGSVSELDGVSVEDLEAVAPEAIQKVRSHPNSPFASREASPVRLPTSTTAISAAASSSTGLLTNGHSHQNGNVLNEAIAQMNGNGNGHLTEQSDDEYIDTIDDYDMNSVTSDSSRTMVAQNHNSRTKQRLNDKRYGTQGLQSHPQQQEVDLRMHNVLSQLNVAVERINGDVQQVMQRMVGLERQVAELEQRGRAVAVRGAKRYPSWWPFKELSPAWVAFIVLWPFVAHKLMTPRRK